jgi:hypothetical protein
MKNKDTFKEWLLGNTLFYAISLFLINPFYYLFWDRGLFFIRYPFMISQIISLFLVYWVLKRQLKKKEGVPFHNWRYIIYLFGLFSAISPLFWLIQWFYYKKNKEADFFSLRFHKRTFYFGWFGIILFAVWIYDFINLFLYAL